MIEEFEKYRRAQRYANLLCFLLGLAVGVALVPFLYLLIVFVSKGSMML